MRFEEMDGVSIGNYLSLYYDLIHNKRQLLVFAGTGVSAKFGVGSWADLLDKLCHQIDEMGIYRYEEVKNLLDEKDDFLDKGEIIKRILSEGLMQAIREAVTPIGDIQFAKQDEVYWIPAISTLCFTTNYDKILERAFEERQIHSNTISINTISPQDETRMSEHTFEKDAIIFKVHGDVDDEEGVILARSDYVNKYGDLETPDHKHTLVRVLRNIAAQFNVLFVGVSLEEEVIARAMAVVFEQGVAGGMQAIPRRYAIMARPAEMENLCEEYDKILGKVQRYGVKCIYYRKKDASDYSGVTTILRQLARDYEASCWNVYRILCHKEDIDKVPIQKEMQRKIDSSNMYEHIKLDGKKEKDDILKFYRNVLVKSAYLENTLYEHIKYAPIKWNVCEICLESLSEPILAKGVDFRVDMKEVMEQNELLPTGNSIYYIYYWKKNMEKVTEIYNKMLDVLRGFAESKGCKVRIVELPIEDGENFLNVLHGSNRILAQYSNLRVSAFNNNKDKKSEFSNGIRRLSATEMLQYAISKAIKMVPEERKMEIPQIRNNLMINEQSQCLPGIEDSYIKTRKLSDLN